MQRKGEGISWWERCVDSVLWSSKQEWLDLCGYNEDHLALEEMDKANRFFGLYYLALRDLTSMIITLHSHVCRPVRILEMGTGYGGLLLRLYQWGKKHNIPLELAGFDVDMRFLEQARKRIAHYPVTLFQGDALNLSTIRDGAYDLYVSTLTLHHFSPQQTIQLLNEAHRVAPLAIYFRDLRRCLHGWGLTYLALKTACFSSITQYDGVLSLRRAYRVKQLQALLQQTLLPPSYKVKSKIPFSLTISGLNLC